MSPAALSNVSTLNHHSWPFYICIIFPVIAGLQQIPVSLTITLIAIRICVLQLLVFFSEGNNISG